jgi:hypothetical protein
LEPCEHQTAGRARATIYHHSYFSCSNVKLPAGKSTEHASWLASTAEDGWTCSCESPAGGSADTCHYVCAMQAGLRATSGHCPASTERGSTAMNTWWSMAWCQSTRCGWGACRPVSCPLPMQFVSTYPSYLLPPLSTYRSICIQGCGISGNVAGRHLMSAGEPPCAANSIHLQHGWDVVLLIFPRAPLPPIISTYNKQHGAESCRN